MRQCLGIEVEIIIKLIQILGEDNPVFTQKGFFGHCRHPRQNKPTKLILSSSKISTKTQNLQVSKSKISLNILSACYPEGVEIGQRGCQWLILSSSR
jgi:hypothetical protein